MKKTMCDKCGVTIPSEENYSLLECFEGSLEMSDIDLCNPCFEKLEEHLKEFAKDKEGDQ